MKKTFKKYAGFTIIELIVVVAIIAVLASIVLVNVTGYINKARDAAAQGNLASMLTGFAMYVADGGAVGTYANSTTGQTTIAAGSACTGGNAGGNFNSACSAITTLTASTGYTVTRSQATDAWCACIQMKSPNTNYFCVDSTGNKKTTTTACATECPGTGANAGSCI